MIVPDLIKAVEAGQEKARLEIQGKHRMNERILKLFIQSCRHADYEHQNVPKELVEKFAELIVRECRDIVGKTRDQAIEDEWNVDEAMSTAMFDIEEHFGVEE